MTSHIGSGIIVLPLVSVLANVAIAKAFGKKHKLFVKCSELIFKKILLRIYFHALITNKR